MIQEIIVYIIGVLVAAYIAVWLYRIIRRRNSCCGCNGCDTKSLYGDKRRKHGTDSGCGCGCGS